MTVRILVGDVREQLRTLPSDSVDCVVTSPPYWGLRDYDVEGQIGLEPTLGEHLEVMVDVFREVRRVVKPHGTVWINYGDCYATSRNGRSAADTKAAGTDDRTFRDKPFSTVGPIYNPPPAGNPFPIDAGRRGVGNAPAGAVYEPKHATPRGVFETTSRGYQYVDHGGRVVAGGTLKPKDLCMIPNRLAIALQDDGWWVRSEIIWGKPNAMPDSSGTARPSVAHEKIFLLTKSDDADVWRARDSGEVSFFPDLTEHAPLITKPGVMAPRWRRLGAYYDADAVMQGRASDEDAATYRGGSYVGGVPGKRTATGNRKIKAPDSSDTGEGGHGSFHRDGREAGKTRALSPRHEGKINHTGIDQVGRGADRLLRNYEPAPLTVWEMAIRPFGEAHFATFPPELAQRAILAGCPGGGIVLDPFGGAGTTGLVAENLGRNSILIELNPEYAAIADNRIRAAIGKVEGLPLNREGLPDLLRIMEAAE